jgi:hypothetical protein
VQYVLGELLIKPVPATAASAIAGPLGASVLDSIPRIGWYRLKFSDGVDVVPIWQSLQSDPRLQSCGFNLAYPVLQDSSAAGGGGENGPEEEIQWPSYITRAVEAWNDVPPNSNVLIAILDTGCDTDHPEFQGCSRIIWGLDWSKWPQLVWPEDYNGHGTRHLGEVAAPLDGSGVAGINQNCRVRVDKITDDHPSEPQWLWWAVAQALDWVVFEENARVVNCSFYGAHAGWPGFELMEDMFFEINSEAPGTVILCCSGNDGDNHPIYYPAAWVCDLECVLAVGASTVDDQLNELTSWKPGELGAELSLLSPGQKFTYYTTDLNGGYSMNAGGTSAGAAHASGIAGMMISRYPGLQNMEIKERLQNSAHRIPGWDYSDPECWGLPCWCERVGSGRIDALHCLARKIFIRCPRTAEGTRSSARQSQEEASFSRPGTAQVSVYDLLGRRLCSLDLPEGAARKGDVLALVRTRSELPVGAKLVRLQTEGEVHTWRLAP